MMNCFGAGHNEDAASILRQFDVAVSSGQQAQEREQASSAPESAQSHLRESLTTDNTMGFAPTPGGGSWDSTAQNHRYHPQVCYSNTTLFFVASKTYTRTNASISYPCSKVGHCLLCRRKVKLQAALILIGQRGKELMTFA